MSAKKGVGVWISGFLTFFAALHTLDAFLSLTSGQTNLLLKICPINRWLGDVDVTVYFWASLLSAFALLGVTSFIACHNPLTTLYDKVLAEVEFAEKDVDSALESETPLLDMINNSLTSNSVVLQTVKSDLGSLNDGQESLKVKIGCLRSKLNDLEAQLTVMFKKLKTDMTERDKCPSCGRKVSPGFRFCPYCGEKLWYGIIRMEPISNK